MWPLKDCAKSELIIAGKTISEHRLQVLNPAIHLLNDDAWISQKDQYNLLQNSHGGVLIDNKGRKLANYGKSNEEIEATTSLIIEYPWHILTVAEEVVAKMQDSQINGEVSDLARLDGCITVGKGSRILPGVYIEGNVSIGENCKIGPNCYIRGNTSIQDNVIIGQSVEVKNSVIGKNTAIGHLSYLGDSVIGNYSNFGAGTVVSNYRHDASNHWSMVNGERIDTGRLKFGTILGDYVHTGINTSIYPGRKLESKSSTLPGAVIFEDHHA